MRLSALPKADERPANPPYLGVRFDRAGRPVRDGGVTVIHHITDPDANRALSAARDRIAAADDGSCLAWLPPSSYHMTLFDLLLHSRRDSVRWPKGLSTDAEDGAADRFLFDKLRRFDPGDAAPFRIALRGISAEDGGLGVAVVGADAREETRLRALRDRLGAA
ncbi:MAG: DUF1868 domain-containing protein, partial [Pseudomonadota bacterium]